MPVAQKRYIYRNRVDKWLSRAGGGITEGLSMGRRTFRGDDGNVLKLDCGYDCTTHNFSKNI